MELILNLTLNGLKKKNNGSITQSNLVIVKNKNLKIIFHLVIVTICLLTALTLVLNKMKNTHLKNLETPITKKNNIKSVSYKKSKKSSRKAKAKANKIIANKTPFTLHTTPRNLNLNLNLCADGINKISESLNKSRLQEINHHVNNAIKTLTNCSPAFDKNPVFYNELAKLYLINNKFHYATYIYKKLIEKNPRISAYWLGLGLTQYNEHHYAIANQAFDQAIKLQQLPMTTVLYLHGLMLKDNKSYG